MHVVCRATEDVGRIVDGSQLHTYVSPVPPSRPAAPAAEHGGST
jgi:hypothetical protein